MITKKTCVCGTKFSYESVVVRNGWKSGLKRAFCDSCSGVFRGLSGRDYAREVIRIKFKHTCQTKECGRVWKEGERRFDVHHLKGMCGKKSRGNDTVRDRKDLFTILCHGCHMQKHSITRQWHKNQNKLASVSKSILADLIWQGKSYDEVGVMYGVSSAAIHYRVNGRKGA